MRGWGWWGWHLRGVDSRGYGENHRSDHRHAHRSEDHRALPNRLATALVVGVLNGRSEKCVQPIGFEVDEVNGEASRQTDRPEIRAALGLVHIVLPDKHQRPHAANARSQQRHDVRIPVERG